MATSPPLRPPRDPAPPPPAAARHPGSDYGVSPGSASGPASDPLHVPAPLRAPAPLDAPALLDERSRPDFRTVYGRLFGRSDRVDVAIRRIRLAGMTLGPPELQAPERVRVLLAEINVLTLGAEADAMAVTRDGRARIELLLDLLDREALRVRSAPLGGWAPDFSVFHPRAEVSPDPAEPDPGGPAPGGPGCPEPGGSACPEPGGSACPEPGGPGRPNPGGSGCREPGGPGRPNATYPSQPQRSDRGTDSIAGPPKGPVPGPVLLTGLHWFERPYPHRGPALASLHRGAGAARIAARFEDLWNAGHDVSPAIRRILAGALARVPKSDSEPVRRSARKPADQPQPGPARPPADQPRPIP